MAGLRFEGQSTTGANADAIVPLNTTDPVFLLQYRQDTQLIRPHESPSRTWPGMETHLTTGRIRVKDLFSLSVVGSAGQSNLWESVEIDRSVSAQHEYRLARFTHFVPVAGYVSAGVIRARILAYDSLGGLTKLLVTAGNESSNFVFDEHWSLRLPKDCSQVLSWMAPGYDQFGNVQLQQVILTYNNQSGETQVHYFTGVDWSSLSPTYGLPAGLGSIVLLRQGRVWEQSYGSGVLVAHKDGELRLQWMGVQLADQRLGTPPRFFLGDIFTTIPFPAGSFELRAVGATFQQTAFLAYDAQNGLARIDIVGLMPGFAGSREEWFLTPDMDETLWPRDRKIATLGTTLLRYNAKDGLTDYFRYQPV